MNFLSGSHKTTTTTTTTATAAVDRISSQSCDTVTHKIKRRPSGVALVDTRRLLVERLLRCPSVDFTFTLNFFFRRLINIAVNLSSRSRTAVAVSRRLFTDHCSVFTTVSMVYTVCLCSVFTVFVCTVYCVMGSVDSCRVDVVGLVGYIKRQPMI